MILTLFIILLSLSIILLFLGKYIDSPPLQLGGIFFIFILGLILMLGGLEYQTGVSLNRNETVTGNLTEITQTQNNVYTSYDNEIFMDITINHTFGLFLMILSIAGFISLMTNLEKPIFGKGWKE